MAVVVAPYGTVDITPVLKLEQIEDRITSVRWLNNDRLLVEATYPKMVFRKRERIGRLYAVNKDGSDLVQLRVSKLQRHDHADLFSDMKVLSIKPDDDRHIIVQTYTGTDPTPAVFSVDIYDNVFTKVVDAQHDISNWSSDRNGITRFGIAYDDEKRTIYYRPDVSKDEWHEIYSFSSGEAGILDPILTDEDGKTLYAFTDYGVNKTVLRKFDAESKSFGDIVYQHDKYDVDTAYFRNGKLAGVGYIEDYTTIEYIDEKLKSLQKMIKNSFKGYESYIYDSSDNYNRIIVSLTRSNSPVKFYLVDLTTKKAGFWLSSYPKLEKAPLNAKQAFSFESSDGLTIPGYITLPQGKQKAPLVVMPHGGPRSRDSMDFDPLVQMVSNLGYAVLQVNFRGSTGYGNNFEASGYKEWGQKMQQDVYAAIDYVGKNKLANTAKSCVLGWSYGGYVALTAAFQRPDQFKCIVSVAGISDINELVRINQVSPQFRVFAYDTIGNPKESEDAKFMSDNSAINFADAIKAPLLLIHGEFDDIVSVNQSKAMMSELDRIKHKPHTFIEMPRDTHNIDNQKNCINTFNSIADFLNTYLK